MIRLMFAALLVSATASAILPSYAPPPPTHGTGAGEPRVAETPAPAPPIADNSRTERDVVESIREATQYMEPGPTLPDGSRPDLFYNGTSYEVDWAENWTDGVGQACLYSELSNERGGLILIFGKSDVSLERQYFLRANLACQRAGLDLRVWDDRDREWWTTHGLITRAPK